jgi:glycosyltransferase involved in cell wall biosynthesis
MRIAIVYDCLYPQTVGGAERWYRNLAEHLAARHEITYVTRRQWGAEGPDTPFRTVAVSPGGPLYTQSARRRIWPPIRFGIGVFFHMLRHARDYDVVHSASFPHFSLIGAWLALRLRRRGARLVADWHELWTREYWVSYLGPIGGRVAYAIEGICVRLPERSFTFSRLHEGRLRERGHRGPVVRLTGEYAGPPGARPGDEGSREPLVVFAGRHIPEKGVTEIPAAIDAARREVPSLRGIVFGDGPMSEDVAERVHSLGLEEVVDLPGRVSGEQVDETLGRALCLLLPSRREGYGLVVVESAARGTPAVVVEGPDNAATELVEEGVNGLIAASGSPADLAQAIIRVHKAGAELRASTAAWFERNAERLSLRSSLEAVSRGYEAGIKARW